LPPLSAPLTRSFAARGQLEEAPAVEPETLLIVVVYFLQGALSLSRLALTFYLKDDLGLSPAEVGALTGLATAPWVIKPLYGFASDSLPIFGYRRKSYLALSGLLGCASFAAMASPELTGGKEALLVANVLASAAVACADVVADSVVVEQTRRSANAAANLQSVALCSRYVGAIGASVCAGEALRQLGGARGVFALTAALPLLVTLAASALDEKPTDEAEEEIDAKAKLGEVWQALTSKAVFRPALFLFAWQATPSCGSAFFFFSTATVDSGGLGFDPEFIGQASALGSVAGLVGVFLYNKFFKDLPLSKVVLGTSLLSAALGCAPLVLVAHANREWGLPDRAFSLGDDVLQSALGEVGFLPLLILAARVCPPGVEGALFAALMSIFNVGGLVSQEAGAALTSALGVSETDFKMLGPLIAICAISSLLPLPFLGWLDESEPPAETAETEAAR